MNPAVLALPSGLFRLQCYQKSLLLPSLTPIIRAFSSSLTLDTEETPAMKALKDIPYPSAPPDPSIFESRSNEYDRMCLPSAVVAQKSIEMKASHQSANRGYHPSLVLERLSRERKFEEAEQVRQELVEMNVPIRPSYAYHMVALNVLRQRPWPPNRTETFINWLSLLPGWPRRKELPINFALLKSALLFNTLHLDLKTIAQFSIVLSSKGYIGEVGCSVMACLARYTEPDVSSRILDDMIAASDGFSRSNFGVTPNAFTREAKEHTMRLWSIAIRTHCTAGRPKVAFQMAKRAHEHGLQLTNYTYAYLLGKLESGGLDDLVAELRAHPYCRTVKVAKSRHVVDVSNMTSLPPISREQNLFTNQAIALAILGRSRSGLPAYAVDIIPYFDIYKTDVRGGHPENRLRSRAYQVSLTAISAVFLAELLHHHRRGQFRHVLWVFEKFFHVVGVPREDVTRRLWKREEYPAHLLIYQPLPRRITKTTFTLPTRLWPTPYHTALVWSSLVRLSESEEELYALYDTLLQHSAQFQKTTVAHDHPYHHDHPPHDSSSSSSLSEPVTALADKFDSGHFHPFLIAFTHLQDPKYGLRVLDDMQDRGIKPSSQILGIAAAIQARWGEPTLALRILEIIRETVGRDEEIEGNEDENVDVVLDMGDALGAEVEARKRAKKKEQLLISYTGVLRGFTDRRNIPKARQVAKLLHSHLGYVEERDRIGGGGVDGEDGGHARTDATLRFLRRLEVEGPGAKPDPLPLTESGYHPYPFLKKPDPEVIKILSAAPGTEPY